MAAVEAGKKPEGLDDPQFVGERGRLESRADLVFEFLPIFLRIQAADGHSAGIEGAQALHDLHSGSFPCAVGP